MAIAIESFNEIEYSNFSDNRRKEILQQVQNMSEERIRETDVEVLVQDLAKQYRLEPLWVSDTHAEIDEPKVTNRTVKAHGPEYRDDYTREEYQFWLKFQFRGSWNLFRVIPRYRLLQCTTLYLDPSKQLVEITFKLYSTDEKDFQREKASAIKRAFANVVNVNKDVADLNSEAVRIIRQAVEKEKAKYATRSDFFKKIGVKPNPTSAVLFEAPVVIPQPSPEVPKKAKESKVVEPHPVFAEAMYRHVLNVLYVVGKRLEAKPSLYERKDEEALRDLFLLFLETRYDSATPTGETFNRTGKTDIMLKYAIDGSALFIAECKMWKGATALLGAIDQLLGYLTWRDSKAALILFVQGKSFSKVLETVRKEIINHPRFYAASGEDQESSFSYIFTLPQDNEKKIFLQILAFHVDKQSC